MTSRVSLDEFSEIFSQYVKKVSEELHSRVKSVSTGDDPEMLELHKSSERRAIKRRHLVLSQYYFSVQMARKTLESELDTIDKELLEHISENKDKRIQALHDKRNKYIRELEASQLGSQRVIDLPQPPRKKRDRKDVLQQPYRRSTRTGVVQGTNRPNVLFELELPEKDIKADMEDMQVK
ncbi:hypothetical protein ADUPG1_011232 [Aduncisulcus paluster]|uniref:Uncharacterized protein n=1 Tax=Aduncisulcus paluster TaxID=2918883 RepID=A0ABQ5JUV9_9EUKA|nr:hypothetical protein ADUPG1_011232 [Aduncisulcus paluster]